MVDGNDIVKGIGPIAPTRCGTIPAGYLIEYIFNSNKSESELRKLCTGTGGVVNLLGTSDMKSVYERAMAGYKSEKLVWDACIYSICKEIGAMATVLEGNIDGILLSGGLVYNNDLVNQIKMKCGFLAPVTAYPGEFEMEAMANGVIRILTGENKAKVYTGVPAFDVNKSLL
jgi:butyrate kinase